MGTAGVKVESSRELLALAQRALGLTGVGLAKLLGVSKRTVIRWHAGHSSITSGPIGDPAPHVYAIDPALGQRLHDYAASDPASISTGIAPPPLPIPPPPRDPATFALQTESVVYAACESMDASPRAMKPALFAALQRARLLNLSFDDLLAGLAPPEKKKRQ